MADDQRHGRIFGVLFIVTFVTSIGAVALFQPVLDDPVGYIASGGKDNQIYLGAFLELLLVISNVGNRRRPLPDRAAPERGTRHRVRRRSTRRVRLHRGRDRLRPRRRRPAA